MFLFVILWQRQRYVKGRSLNYIKIKTRGLSDAFASYKVLFACTHDSIIMHWMPNLSFGVEHIAFVVK
jgi:hypothetical protein